MSTYGEEWSHRLMFYVNGQRIELADADPETTLLTFIRSDPLNLTGTKLVCGEGGCGACTVMVSRYDSTTSTIRHYSANSCLLPLCSLHGAAVTTVEGIGSTSTTLHPIQERLAKSHGSQCGFCTPGFVMSMYTLLRNHPHPTLAQIETALEGNLCRCTGYRPILQGMSTFAKDSPCGLGDACCRVQTGSDSSRRVARSLVSRDHKPYDGSRELIFPPELQLSTFRESLRFVGTRVTWYRPTTLQDLLKIRQALPDAKLIAGNTEVGVDTRFKDCFYATQVLITEVPELQTVTASAGGLTVGAAVCLTRLEDSLQKQCGTLEEYEGRSYTAMLEMLKWFAGPQIKNVATLGGNIMTASPVSDLNPLLMCSRAQLVIQSAARGRRTVTFTQEFFQGYRTVDVQPDEVLVAVVIPCTRKDEYVCGYKQAGREQDDISIVNAGMRVYLDDVTHKVKDIQLVYGGMAEVTKEAGQTQKMLTGRAWDEDLLGAGCDSLSEELQLSAGAVGGREDYRCSLKLSFFFKFYLHVKQMLEQLDSPSHLTQLHPREPVRGAQIYEEVSEDQSATDPVGRAMTHLSAVKQVTGEARFIDDMPPLKGELHLWYVYSSEAHARIVSIDTHTALTCTGVVGVLTHKDVPGSNVFGLYESNEEIFVSEKVECEGQIIAAVVATSRDVAQRAAKLIHVQYDVLKPIITIEQAIEAGSYMYEQPVLVTAGDVDAVFNSSSDGNGGVYHIQEGEVRLSGQKHFYLEPHGCVVVPHGEDQEMDVYSSTQDPHGLQFAVAGALDIPANRIASKVRRIGGGFGGKISRSYFVAIPAAIAALKYNKSTRVVLGRDDDMKSTGTRHPALAKYKIAVTKDGEIAAVEMDVYLNAGCSLDYSLSVLKKVLLHIDGAYRLPVVRLRGFLCKTNLPSNTAFRGFGGTQAHVIIETILDEVATAIGIPSEKLKQRNLYKDGDFTHYRNPIEDCTLRRSWQEVLEHSNYYKQQEDIQAFNSTHRYIKRGVAIAAVKHGLTMSIKSGNQAGALVHIYKDGSVLVSHAGIEMGQGLNTKMVQVASKALGVATSKVYLSGASTYSVPNGSATVASISTDVNGMAVKNACDVLVERLKPFKSNNPQGTWEDWVSNAYKERISLSSTGFYSTPIEADDASVYGHKYIYFTTGVAVSSVEVDCLTGNHHVIRSDIVMDVGRTINPAVDIGQIEGAFVQGYGLLTLEDMKYSSAGRLQTKGPGSYKLPSSGNIPAEFNVYLLRDTQLAPTIYSSKGVGEPPLNLSVSVLLAIKSAIRAYRAEQGHQGRCQLHVPATPERIRMACQDKLTCKVAQKNVEQNGHQPWSLDP